MNKKLLDKKPKRRVRRLKKGSCDLRRVQEVLRASEEKYRTILSSIEEGYFEVDLAGNLIFFNDALVQWSGYSREELVGMNNRQFMNEEAARKVFQVFNEAYRTGKPAHPFDWEIIKKDGTKRFVETSVSLIRDSENHPIGFRGIARDVTERNQAEAALQESEEKYRTMLNNIEEGYYEVDQRQPTLDTGLKRFLRGGNVLVSFSEQLPTLKQSEQLLISEAMKRANGNQAIAAGLLGITRQALNNLPVALGRPGRNTSKAL